MDWRDRARRQAGVIARRQLRACGLTERQVDGLVIRRELVEVAPAVYSPRPVPDSMKQRLWAVALWSGGVISHRSAAALWKMPVEPAVAVHVTVDDRRFRKSVPGVQLHRVRLGRLHRTTFDGLPITDRARTVIDLLRTGGFATANDLLFRALQQGWIDEHALEHVIRSEPGRTGNTQLRWLLAGIAPGAHAESERLLHQILGRGGLTGWAPQYAIAIPGGTALADIAFPEQRIALEVDGRRHHDDHSDRFESDRQRQNKLTALGWRVLRFTWSRLTQDPSGVLAEIVQLLAA